jgi:serine/threonine protein kinase
MSLLKIMMAEVSKEGSPELRLTKLNAAFGEDVNQPDGARYICLPLEHFTLCGPNEDHLCLVYPVLGPKASLGLFKTSPNPDRDLRELSHQVTTAVGFLHSQGICHGGK